MEALIKNAMPRTALEARGVGVTFNAESAKPVKAIEEMSFTLQEGETLAIVGPSGCGKSTLFNVIAGLLPATQGEVLVDHQRVDRAAGQVGYMLQKDMLLPWRTVIENVVLGLEVRGVWRAESRKTAQDLIDSFGLKGFEDTLPNQLSGGMRQRVAFMRTLAIDPEVILLDEPFSALDFQTRLVLQAEVMRMIRSRNKSAILVTHDIGEAITMADRIIVLTARPAAIKVIHQVNLSTAERDPVTVRNQPVYNELFTQIWDELGVKIPSS